MRPKILQLLQVLVMSVAVRLRPGWRGKFGRGCRGGDITEMLRDGGRGQRVPHSERKKKGRKGGIQYE